MELYQQSSQKQKLLILQKILLTETDENHPLSVNELIQKLALYDIKAERKTIYDDIATLASVGLDIVVDKRGHSNVYYVGSRLFQDEELLVLADAVASSKFLTVKKSNELIKKLQSLTSKHNATNLRRSIYVGNRVKTFNESIYYSINSIHEAIYKDRNISFKYFEYDTDKKKRYRYDGKLYTVSPYYLIWENDCYYLVCGLIKHGTISRYRVDRMTDVSVTDVKRRQLSVDEDQLAKQLRATYNMFGGRTETVTLEMSSKLINVVIDRFGESVRLNRISDDRFTVRAEVQISPTFWGWLFQFGTQARVVAPKEVVSEAQVELKKILDMYNAGE